MNRKKLLISFICAGMLCMTTACGNQIPEMTEQESAMVTQYAANLLLSYSGAYQSRLVDTSQGPETDEAVENAPAPVQQENPSNEEPAETEKPQGVEGSDALAGDDTPQEVQLTIAQVLGMESVSVEYTGYRLCDSYPEESATPEDMFFAMSAAQDSKLLVLDLSVTNTGTDVVQCNTLNIPAKYKVVLNGEHTQNALITMLADDFSAIDMQVQAGETVHAVIITEISQERADALQSVGLEVKLDEKRTVITQ